MTWSSEFLGDPIVWGYVVGLCVAWYIAEWIWRHENGE